MEDRLRGTLVLIAACLITVAVPLWGQADAAAQKDASIKAPTYEVVSIKPNKSGSNGGSWYRLPDGIRATNMPLRFVVYSAYNIIFDSQVTGLPGWAESDLFDIEAKVDVDTAEAWKKLSDEERWGQQQLMLQSLLADRCQFKVHREMRELPVYDLVIARGGLKMKEAPASEHNAETSSWGGKMGRITAHATSVESLADSLSGRVGRITMDKTGLTGKNYDFTLEWTPDEQRDAPDAGPSIFTALEEQLGLRLVAAKGSVKILVIDHMERPSAN
jgi:uncharacterized protein (TIGR03435 family)